MPTANALIRNSVFDPDTFKAVVAAFDESWIAVGSLFTGQPQSAVEEARTILANAVINAAQVGHKNEDVLKQEGFKALKAAYPQMAF